MTKFWEWVPRQPCVMDALEEEIARIEREQEANMDQAASEATTTQQTPTKYWRDYDDEVKPEPEEWVRLKPAAPYRDWYTYGYVAEVTPQGSIVFVPDGGNRSITVPASSFEVLVETECGCEMDTLSVAATVDTIVDWLEQDFNPELLLDATADFKTGFEVAKGLIAAEIERRFLP